MQTLHLFQCQNYTFFTLIHKSHQVGNELKPNLSVHNWQYGGIKADHFGVEKR